MLRITARDDAGALTIRLEGVVAGPCVRVLEEYWRGVPADPGRPAVRVDLTGVTSIDAAGKACLAAMHNRGAEFIAADCLTKAVVAEIAETPGAGRTAGRPGKTHGSRPARR